VRSGLAWGLLGAGVVILLAAVAYMYWPAAVALAGALLAVAGLFAPEPRPAPQQRRPGVR
jgi:hypothetical protein